MGEKIFIEFDKGSVFEWDEDLRGWCGTVPIIIKPKPRPPRWPWPDPWPPWPGPDPRRDEMFDLGKFQHDLTNTVVELKGLIESLQKNVEELQREVKELKG